ncbi:TIM barrel protein [Fodinicurvata sp. EGI_FJ10296]|uniref:sugar phosphate isomerase/epimerase family protein n=1 Tax=Fodinicurvata sp. EGI_FJ10296 TaxID=3231908 RepID=UPI0034549EDB
MTTDIALGTNLSFAVKRWVEPEAWAGIVRAELELDLAQFSFDILDPWWPSELRGALTRRIRRACEAEGIVLHSAFVGLASYTYNQLLHPEPEGREAGLEWFRRAIDTAADLGVREIGGPLGALSPAEAADATRRHDAYERLIDMVADLTDHAAARGLAGFVVEPTPLPREFFWRVEDCLAIRSRLSERTAVPISFCLDWGHALYRPLYGLDGADVRPWLVGLGEHIGQFHLQQTDGVLDRHWGFTRDDGIVDPVQAANLIRGAGLSDRPVFLEVFYPFETADDQVLSDMKRCVSTLKEAFST